MLAVFSLSTVATAQGGPCTESAVKKTIAAKSAVPHTDDRYFFSGALDKPVIGRTAGEQASATVVAGRKNASQDDKTERIVAADSGDMAYEYGTAHIAFDDLKTGKHEDFTSAYLRVWKADKGVCKVAAEMAEPENNAKQPPGNN
jgi:ketosteroid isomerase-like protein